MPIKPETILRRVRSLPECFRIKSPSACYLPVPEDQQLAELNIVGSNI